MEKGEFHYLEWQDLYSYEKPFQILIDLPKDAPQKRKTNLVFTKGFEEVVEDVRGHLSDYNLDTHGFTYENHPTSLRGEDFNDKSMIEDIYLSECEAILKTMLDGVDQIHFYNWLVCLNFTPSRYSIAEFQKLRDTDPSKIDGKIVDLNDSLTRLGPSQVVHIGLHF